MTKPKLLIVEDDAALAAQYRWAFPDCRVLLAHDRAGAIAMAQREQPAAVLLDLGLPPDAEGVAEGFATLEALQLLTPGLPVIVASGQGERANMLRAVALGAYDFCEKPVDLAVLRTIIDRALRLRRLEEENRRLAALPRQSPVRDIITADDAMLKICRTVERLAQVSVPVLLLGESGTGKEALARALHEMGPRAGAAFIAINCAAIPEALLESELFGHERGAFTGALNRGVGRFEQAAGGTLFLDEIGDMPAEAQTRLLRVLQEGEFTTVGGRQPIKANVRIVAATHRDLRQSIRSGMFREDLFYRLNVVPIRLPPLRERLEDIPLLARHFLERARAAGLPLKQLDPSAMDRLKQHAWPGNARELENLMRRLAALYPQESIGADAVAAELAEAALPAEEGPRAPETLEQSVERHLAGFMSAHRDGMPIRDLYDRVLAEVERPLLKLALSATRGNQIKAAAMLGLNRNTLRKKLRELDLPVVRGLP